MAKLEIVVGQDLRAAANEVAEAWKAAAEGRDSVSSDKVVFRDWAALCAVLTPVRFSLLRTLHGMPGTRVGSLADALGRDVADIQADIAALGDIGLIEQNGAGDVSTCVDEITSTIRIAA